MFDVQRYQTLAKSYWRLNTLVARAGVQTLTHRLLGEKPRATWSLPFESTVRMMALGSPNEEVSDVLQIRAPIDGLSRLPTLLNATRTPIMAGPVPGEWVDVANSSAERIILFLHGGGYVFGSPTTHRLLTATIARTSGARVLSLDYRLAPEHPFPAAVEDAWAAYWWLLSQNFDPKQIVVIGDSAGGGLSVALMLALRDAGLPLPAGAVLMSPWVDLSLQADSIHKNEGSDYLNEVGLRSAARMYAEGCDVKAPLISPLFADLHGLPPILIQTGTAEVLYDDARRFAQHAKEDGVTVEFEEWEDMVHVFQFWYLMEPKARQAVHHIGEFVRRHTQKQSSQSVDAIQITIRKWENEKITT